MADESNDTRTPPPPRPYRLLALVAIYFIIAHLFQAPDGVGVEQWRRVAVFFGTIAGLMLQPMPGSLVVLVGIVAMIAVGNLPMDRALSGYSAASVWMVLMAMLMSRAGSRCGSSGSSAEPRSGSATRSI